MNVPVSVYAVDHDSIVAETFTDAAGSFRFRASAVPSGTYRLRFNRDEFHLDPSS